MLNRSIAVWTALACISLGVALAWAQAKPDAQGRGAAEDNPGKDKWARQNDAVQKAFGPVDIRRDVIYAKVNGKDMMLDLFVPKAKPKPGEVRPLVVWVHGGGWKQGNKERCFALFLVKAGYAVASINYRLTNEATFPAQIWDCKAAIRFLRARANEFGYDPAAIGVMGGSAGGHLAALLGTTNDNADLEGKLGDYPETSSNVQAVCDWFGPTHLAVEYFDGKEFPKERIVPMDPDQILNTDVNKSTPKNELTDLLGGPPARVMEKARLASPVLQVSKDDVPVLVMHGDKDNIVPVYQSRMFVAKLQEVGVPVEYVEIAGAGHGGGQFFAPEILGKVRVFFDKHLRKMDTGPEEGAQEEKAKPKGTLPRTFNTR